MVKYGGRRWIGLLAINLLLLANPADAGLLASTIDEVGVSLPANARVPGSISLLDEAGAQRTLADVRGGRASLLILADYTCRAICGPVVSLAAAALERSGLTPGVDYRLIVVGLDPKDRPADAQAMKRAQLGDDGALVRATSFLIADDAALAQLTQSLGYRAAYDAANDQFAHPAAIFVLTADGRVARALSGLGIEAGDIRLALVEAGNGQVGGLADRIRLLCYGFDPSIGAYTPSVHWLLLVACLVSAAGLAGAIGLMARAGRSAGAS